MLLIIHAGLHKTASTYLQHVLLLNREALRSANVYFAPDPKIDANHFTAWMALADNFSGVSQHVAKAAEQERRAAILSSEDFEGLIFAPKRAAMLEQVARDSGATTIEWHFSLRRPGEYFSSLYAELSRHAIVGFIPMFAEVSQFGRLRVSNNPKHGIDSWEFCFDYETHLIKFARSVDGTVVVHGFADNLPYPGHAIVDRLDAGVLPATPGMASRNSRGSAEVVEANLLEQFEKVATSGGLSDDIRFEIGRQLYPGLHIQAACAEAIDRRFAAGMERILEKKVLRLG